MTGGAVRVGKIPVEDCGRCASYTSMTGGAADRLLELQYHSGIEFQPNRSLLHIEHGERITAMYFVIGTEPRNPRRANARSSLNDAERYTSTEVNIFSTSVTQQKYGRQQSGWH